MHDGLSSAAVADGVKPSRGIGVVLANASPRIGIYASLLSHVHSLEVTAPFNFDYGLTGLVYFHSAPYSLIRALCERTWTTTDD